MNYEKPVSPSQMKTWDYCSRKWDTPSPRGEEEVMDDKELARLRQLAKRATSGPWGTNPSGTVVWSDGYCRIVEDDAMLETNARFIAAANPETVLALLDRLEAVEREKERLLDQFRSGDE